MSSKILSFVRYLSQHQREIFDFVEREIKATESDVQNNVPRDLRCNGHVKLL